MIGILLAVFSICISFLIYPSGLPQCIYFVMIWMLRSKWRRRFIKFLLKEKSNISTKGVCTLPEEIDLIDRQDETVMDRICFYGFHEDGTMIAFSQLKVANVKKHRLTYRYSGDEIYVWEEDVIMTQNECTGKMNLIILEPFRKWRISFQGFLKSVNGKERSIYANISLLWQSSSDPYECVQTRTLWSFAKFSAARFMAYSELKKIITGQKFRFDQWGGLSGTLDIDQLGKHFIRLESPRSRTFSFLNENDGEARTIHYIKMKDKCWMLMLMTDCLYDYKTQSGHIIYPNSETWPLTLKTAASDRTVYKSFLEETAFTNDGECKTLKISSQYNDNYDKEAFAYERFKMYYVNDEAAFGCQVTEESKQIVFKMNIRKSALHQNVCDDVCNIPLVISLKHSLSKCPDIAGGKGASLSKLLDMENDLDVIIPMGFCLTSKAYVEHIRENEELACSIASIRNCLRNKQMHELNKCCENATATMKQTKLSNITQAVLIDQLCAHFGSEYENEYLAVRSSAYGEDGFESSSAGQMETILNVKGLDSIIQAILKCWASSLSFNILEYRRQNGQSLSEQMAVVIQKMIKSEVSGVLFTADPLTNKGSTIVINALPGLGEVVVSGKSNVDTIFITRTLDRHLYVRERVSAKREQDGENNTSEQNICLQDEMALKICQVAISVEAQFGGHIDIEWAISGGCVYILQARPIVSVDGETDEELMHEFDTPVTDWKECLTTGNIGEILPGSTTPLTMDLFGRALDMGTKIMYGVSFGLRYSTYASIFVCTFYYRMFLNLSFICAGSINGLFSNKDKLEMFVMGEILPDNSMQNLVSFCGRKASLRSRLIGFFKVRFETWRAVKILRSYEKRLRDFTIGHHATNSKDLMEEIELKHEHYFKVWGATVFQNAQSATGSAIIMSLLCQKSNTITPDVSADLASLLSNCENVNSADVPAALADLAKIINASDQKDYFLDLSDEESHEFLISSEIFGEKYRSFLERHGHRCVREVDFSEQSWGMDPSKLIQSLKAIISNGLVNILTKPQNIKEIVETLRSPLTFFQKLLFRSFLVSFARQAVAKREWGKSLAIKMGDGLKQAYWKLADLMVQEGRLPEQDLLFYLTHTEIKTLLETRSPELVRKSRKRRQISKTLLLYKFKKVNYGTPVPLPLEVEKFESSMFEGKGMSLSRGIVTGRACVIKDISEVGEIHKGDILICLYTDVGWTPYFPLLSGLVTEIGGLISHGAVVAREYGLPCIVCMSNATKIFKTGDIVKLNATDGTLSKIEVELKTSK